MSNSSQWATSIFSSKYASYSSMLFKLCMTYLANPWDAEDAVQEAFIRLIYKTPDFEDQESEKRWLLRVAANICKDKLRKTRSRRTVVLEDVACALKDQSHLDTAIAAVEVPAIFKDVLYLYYYERYKVAEIASILHISVSAVKMRLMRGREFLRMEMEDLR